MIYLFIILILIGLLLPVIAVIDILRSTFSGNNKIVWLLVVIFFPYLGALLYFLFAGRQKIR